MVPIIYCQTWYYLLSKKLLFIVKHSLYSVKHGIIISVAESNYSISAPAPLFILALAPVPVLPH